MIIISTINKKTSYRINRKNKLPLESDTFFTNLRIFSCQELISNQHLIPTDSGIYLWFFKEFPSQLIHTGSCVKKDDLTLLYLGIVPKNSVGRRHLRDRIYGNHINGNAESSTLRLSLGCLLREQLSIQLRCVNNENTFRFCTFDGHDGEPVLTNWMRENAFVSWVIDSTPWTSEKVLIQSHNLPLNIQHNGQNANVTILKTVRKNSKNYARSSPNIFL